MMYGVTEPRLTSRLVQDQLVSSFVLADVGASSGIAHWWKALGNALHATGFDPLITEVARLNATESNPNIRYIAAMLGYRRYKEVFPDSDWTAKPNDSPWFRTSAVRAQQVTGKTFDQQVYDPAGSLQQVLEVTELNEHFVGKPVDFLKTDTDGFDMAVLLGARDVLTGSPVLAVQAEVFFQGVLNDYSGTFSNVDRFLRSLGFSLFDIVPNRYSRGKLPTQFRHRQCADTFTGQVIWADVLYVRDGAAPKYEEAWGMRFSAEQIFRLACIYELYGLDDCAAELLETFRDRLPCDVEPYLDLITPELGGKRVTFREYNEAFERDVTAFF
jgi:FkbM family methyltransferase